MSSMRYNKIEQQKTTAELLFCGGFFRFCKYFIRNTLAILK